jgi:protein-tyrosine phosphatase
MTIATVASSAITRILRHPLVMRVKAPIKAAFWDIRGRSLPEPRVPESFDSILFVCKGNICRSPFAERLTQKLLRELNRGDIRAASAGLAVSAQGGTVPAAARSVALSHGVSLEQHTPTQLDESLVASYALVVVMEAAQLAEIGRRFPAHRERFILLAQLVPDSHRARSGFERYNIADPYGQPESAFMRCYDIIDVTLRRLLEKAGTLTSAS